MIALTLLKEHERAAVVVADEIDSLAAVKHWANARHSQRSLLACVAVYEVVL